MDWIGAAGAREESCVLAGVKDFVVYPTFEGALVYDAHEEFEQLKLSARQCGGSLVGMLCSAFWVEVY